MTRRVLALLLLCLLARPVSQAEPAGQTALYTGQMRVSGTVLDKPDTSAKRLGYLPQGATLDIIGVEPEWLLIRYRDTLTGYVRRSYLNDVTVRPKDPAVTPPYAAVECGWLAWILEDAPILSAPEENAEALITLHRGARLALIDITDGWGRIIYHRQYGYIDTRHLSEILPVNRAEAQGDESPIAAYTSFYRITTDQSNLNRIENLKVACGRFSLYTLNSGDKLNFNDHIGPYSRRIGYLPANALVKGEVVQSYGGGTCQVSSTLYNVILQLPGIQILRRRAHGPAAASYLPHGADAAVGSDTQNFIIRNAYPYPVRIDGTVQDGALTISVYRAD